MPEYVECAATKVPAWKEEGAVALRAGMIVGSQWVVRGVDDGAGRRMHDQDRIAEA